MSPNSPPLLLALGAFVSMGGLAAAGWILLRGRAETSPTQPRRSQTLPLTRERLSPGQARVGAVLESLAAPSQDQERSQLERALIQANWRGPYDLQIFLGARVALSGMLPVALALALHPTTLVHWVGAVLLGITAGYYLPGIVLQLKRRKRQERLMAAFSDGLDMLVSALGAGLGLDAAMQRVGRELAPSAPELASELSMVITEAAAGIRRAEALARLDERTGLPEINNLVSVLTQAERYGVGVAAAIRAHAALVRARRGLAAEKKAAEAAPKLTIVMILFILPPLFVVILGPTVVNVVENALPNLRAGRP